MHEADNSADLGSSSNYFDESRPLACGHRLGVQLARKAVVEEVSLRSAIGQGSVVPNPHWNLLELRGERESG